MKLIIFLYTSELFIQNILIIMNTKRVFTLQMSSENTFILFKKYVINDLNNRRIQRIVKQNKIVYTSSHTHECNPMNF